MHGKNDYLCVRNRVSDAEDCLNTIYTGHTDVNYRNIGLQRLGLLYGFLSGRCLSNDIPSPLRPKNLFYGTTDDGVTVSYKNTHAPHDIEPPCCSRLTYQNSIYYSSV